MVNIRAQARMLWKPAGAVGDEDVLQRHSPPGSSPIGLLSEAAVSGAAGETGLLSLCGRQARQATLHQAEQVGGEEVLTIGRVQAAV